MSLRHLRLLLLLCLSMLATGACTLSVQGTPRAMKSMEKQALKGGAELTDSYGEYVARLPGLTISGSVSHMIGGTPLSARPLPPLSYDSSANAPRLQFVPYEGGCNVDMRLVSLLQAKTDELFAQLGTGRSWRRFDVSMHFVPESATVRREITAVRLGRHVSQRFYFPCSASQAQRDIFHGVLTSLHEITHGMSAISGHDAGRKSPQHGVTDEEEVLAEGGPSCLYEALAGKDDAGLQESLPPSLYLAGDWELDGTRRTASDLCQLWLRTFSLPGASQPLPSAGSP